MSEENVLVVRQQLEQRRAAQVALHLGVRVEDALAVGDEVFQAPVPVCGGGVEGELGHDGVQVAPCIHEQQVQQAELKRIRIGKGYWER